MVQASIDNTPISIQLASNESVTVPTGETWKINVQAKGNSGGDILVNNKAVAYADTSVPPTNPEFETTVTAGDTVGTGYAIAHVGGFKI